MKLFRKIFFYTLFFSIMVACQSEPKNESPDDDMLTVEVQIFHYPQGYGYDVIVGGDIYIHQEFIPCIPGKHAFKTWKDAHITASLVAEKISREIIPPSLTIEELDSIGVIDADTLPALYK